MLLLVNRFRIFTNFLRPLVKVFTCFSKVRWELEQLFQSCMGATGGFKQISRGLKKAISRSHRALENDNERIWEI
jgi:hypothetical protein